MENAALPEAFKTATLNQDIFAVFNEEASGIVCVVGRVGVSGLIEIAVAEDEMVRFNLHEDY